MILVAAAIAAAVALIVLALIAFRRRPTTVTARVEDDGLWTAAAGSEFATLSEAQRCDLVFAFGALDDERSRLLLERALGDPCEAVALAAAHALGRRGCVENVRQYFAAHPGERASRIAATLALLS